MPRTNPCLWFNDIAEEAASYFVSLFPNSRVGTIERHPEGSPSPPDFPPVTALAVAFALDDESYVALNVGPEFASTETISFQIMCEDQGQIDRHWETSIGDGGEEGPYGGLKDKYGLSWQVVPTDLDRCATDPAKSTKEMQAIAGMKKFDPAALHMATRNAWDGWTRW